MQRRRRRALGRRAFARRRCVHVHQHAAAIARLSLLTGFGGALWAIERIQQVGDTAGAALLQGGEGHQGHEQEGDGEYLGGGRRCSHEEILGRFGPADTSSASTQLVAWLRRNGKGSSLARLDRWPSSHFPVRTIYTCMVNHRRNENAPTPMYSCTMILMLPTGSSSQLICPWTAARRHSADH